MPTTAPVPWRAQAARCARVPAGRVKSIITSAACAAASASAPTVTPVARPNRSPASRPTTGLAATSTAAASAQPRIREDRLDQRLAHLSAGARDGDAHRRHFFLKMSRNCSHHERGSDQEPSPAVMAWADLLSSAIEIGISSPSQRASLSSTK